MGVIKWVTSTELFTFFTMRAKRRHSLLMTYAYVLLSRNTWHEQHIQQ